MHGIFFLFFLVAAYSVYVPALSDTEKATAEAFGSHETAPKRALVIVPHPDDEVICCSGVITRLLRDGFAVRIVITTIGDKFIKKNAFNERLKESVEGLSELGVEEDAITFLAYPDGKVKLLGFTPIVGNLKKTETNAFRGFRRLDYHAAVFNTHASFTYDNLYIDLHTIISTFLPQHIFLANTKNDSHPDHAAIIPIVKNILAELYKKSCEHKDDNLNMDIILHQAPVWTGEPIWPNPVNFNKAFVMSSHYEQGGIYKWSEKESITLPGSMFLAETSPKEKAIMHHVSQSAQCGFISRFIHSNEVFWAERYSLGLECEYKKTKAMLVAVVEAEPIIVKSGEEVPLIAEWKWAVLGDSQNETQNTLNDYESITVECQWQQRAGPEIDFVNNIRNTSVVIPENIPINSVFEFEFVAKATIHDRVISSVPTSVILKVKTIKDGEYGRNIAPLANIKNEMSYFTNDLRKLVDGNPDGYIRHGIGDKTEWVKRSKNANLTFTWNAHSIIRKIVLYDTPRCEIHAETVYITFPNKRFGPYTLPNDGRPMEIIIPVQKTRQLSIYLEGPSSASHIGLAEVEIFGFTKATYNVDLCEFSLISYFCGLCFQVVGVVLVMLMIKPSYQTLVSEFPSTS